VVEAFLLDFPREVFLHQWLVAVLFGQEEISKAVVKKEDEEVVVLVEDKVHLMMTREMRRLLMMTILC